MSRLDRTGEPVDPEAIGHDPRCDGKGWLGDSYDSDHPRPCPDCRPGLLPSRRRERLWGASDPGTVPTTPPDTRKGLSERMRPLYEGSLFTGTNALGMAAGDVLGWRSPAGLNVVGAGDAADVFAGAANCLGYVGDAGADSEGFGDGFGLVLGESFALAGDAAELVECVCAHGYKVCHTRWP